MADQAAGGQGNDPPSRCVRSACRGYSGFSDGDPRTPTPPLLSTTPCAPALARTGRACRKEIEPSSMVFRSEVGRREWRRPLRRSGDRERAASKGALLRGTAFRSTRIANPFIKERIYIDKAMADTLHDEITVKTMR